MLTKWKQSGHYFEVQCLMCMLRNVVFDVYFHISVLTLKPFWYWNIWSPFIFSFSFSTKFENLMWAQVNRWFKTEYGCSLTLFDLIITIPATSVASERCFTHMLQFCTLLSPQWCHIMTSYHSNPLYKQGQTGRTVIDAIGTAVSGSPVVILYL